MTLRNGTSGYGYAGLFAANSGTIKNLRIADVNIQTSAESALLSVRVAGVNNNGATIENVAVASGTINSYGEVGGIVGVNYGNISNSYNKAAVGSTSSYTGGIAGRNDGTATIERVYNAGTMSGSYAEGIVYRNAGNATINYAYTITPKEVVNSSSPSTRVYNSSTYTSAQMRSQSSYDGFDFDDIWEIEAGEYPTLQVMIGRGMIRRASGNEPDGSAQIRTISHCIGG